MYKAEDDHQQQQYTAEQLGEPIYRPVTSKSKDPYDLLVMDENYQVQVLEGCSWNACAARVKDMVRAGVDPADIRGMRYRHLVDGPGWREAGLDNVGSFLWWTSDDEARLEAERQEA
jgi:hypothetical protein